MKKLVRVSLFVLMALTLSLAIGCKNDSDPEPAPADFAGEWKSTDGAGTVSVKDGEFSTVIEGLNLKGTYTVDGNTATTSKVKIPAELTGGSEVSVSFTMKMVDGDDVMALTVPAELTGNKPSDMTFVKTSSTKPDLTGTWTGKVVIDEKGTLGDATIVFANNKANLTLPGQTEPVTATVTQDGNFFTITLEDEQKSYELTGLISVSGKAWLDEGSVFTKQ
ncbi:MAG: hypothetical protein IJX45_08150 [Spirochaetaceae bacterium]|nr:hypothetical protein [Spirochaetaceae bacterium]